MAAVPITIVGSMTQNEKSEQVTIVGLASLTGLEVGGGPMPGGKPPGIWGGGNEPFPTPPIHLPPGSEKPPDPVEPPVKWKTIWTPTEGWVVVGIITPEGPHPTPSQAPPPPSGRRG